MHATLSAVTDTNLLENLGLEVRGQLRVDGQHGQRRSVLQVLQPLHDLIRRHLQGQGHTLVELGT